MYCCLKRPSKSRAPVKEVLETFGDRAQGRESQSRLPSPSSVSSEAGTKNYNPAALVTAELDSNESEIGRFHGAVSTAKRPDELHLRLSDWNENEVTESEEVVPAIAQQGPLLRDGAISAVPKANKLDEVVPADAKQSRDLWKEAYAKLSKDKQDLLSKIEEPQGRSVVEKVTEQIEQSYCKHEGKRWKMASKKGFESALKSILKCKELISACLASDPTGHAAAVWTIVSLGLQMVQNNADLRDNVFQACGILAETLTLMAAVERSYRDRRVCDSDNLEDTIVGVYLAILELSAEIVFENSLNTGQRILNSFTALAEQPLQEFKRALTSEQEKMSRWTKIVEQQYRTQEGTEIGEKVESMFARIQGLAQQVSNIATRTLTEEEQRIFDWLSKYSFSDSQNSVAQRREPGTRAWILSLPEYKDWRTSDSSLLWLYGKSGCGKSVLCSSIITDLEKPCASEATDSGYVLAYWYFTFSNQDSVNIENLLSSIIRQLCAGTKQMPSNVRELWKKHHMAGSRPTKAGLIESLDAVMVGLNTNDQHALVVLDGLDEYPLVAELASSKVQPCYGRKAVMEWLQTFYQSHPNAHVLITSRDETDIRKCFGGSTQLDVAKGLTDDVDLFLQSCIDRTTDGDDNWKNEFRLKMIEKMRGGNERRFRWVALVEQRLLNCLDHQMMEDALRTLPQTLEGLYGDLLRQIPTDYKEKVRLVLIWLAYSLRPLTLRELASAVSVRNPQKVLEICNSSLVSLQWNPVVYKRDEPLVNFDHFSVKEYLTSGHLLASEELVFFHATPLLAHVTIAEISVSYILATNGTDLTTRSHPSTKHVTHPIDWPGFPLLDYSTIWFKHVHQVDALDKNLKSDGSTLEARSAAIQPEIDSLRTQTHDLFCEGFSQSLQNWYHLLRGKYWPTESIGYGVLHCGDSISPMIIASLLNLPDNVRRLINNGSNLDGDEISCSTSEEDFLITKPIQAAALSGNLAILGLLLEQNAILTQSDLDLFARKNRRHGAAVLGTILEARPDLRITDATTRASVQNGFTGMLSYVLDNYDLMSPALLEAILKKCSSVCYRDDLIEKIISRGDKIGCDRKRMLEIFLRSSYCKNNIKIVIDRYHPADSMSQEIVNWVFDNKRGGGYMLPEVLKYYKDLGVEVEITQEMLVKAACPKNRTGTELFAVILGYTKRTVITTDVMEKIVNNASRYNLMNLLMSKELSRAHADRLLEWQYLANLHSEEPSSSNEYSDELIMKAAACGEPEAFAYLQAHARPNVTFARTLAEGKSLNADA